MISLTRENYYSKENTYISSTKVRDFLKSKEFYFKRYVEGSIPEEETTSIQLGKIIDKALTQGTMYQFHRTYRMAVKKKDDADTFAKHKEMDTRRILTPALYTAAVNIIEKVLRSPFYRWYQEQGKQSQKQVILWNHYPIVEEPKFSVCGMLDRMTIKDDVPYIDDYKTSSSASLRSPKTWYWHCLEWGYFIQMAAYKWLVEQYYPELKEPVCRHIVLGTSKIDFYPIKLYVIPPILLKEPLELFFRTAQEITDEQKWFDDLPGWPNAELLPDFAEGGEEPEEVDTETMDAL